MENAENVIADPQSNDNVYQWAEDNRVYISQATLEKWLAVDSRKLLIVDVRDDEDFIGGRIRGAVHCSDKSLSEPTNLSALASDALSLGSDGMVVFHCMESLRRGPRCAKRMTLLFDLMGDIHLPSIKVLEGGADKWIRKYWDTPLVEGYDDDYWGFREDQAEGEHHHRLYVSPNDGLSGTNTL